MFLEGTWVEQGADPKGYELSLNVGLILAFDVLFAF